MTDMPLWTTGVADQIQAALQNKDPKAFAATGLDGLLRAADYDAGPDGKLSFEMAVRGVLKLPHEALLVLLAEALCRLYNQDKP